MGRGVLHLFPLIFVLTVTLTTDFPSSEWFQTKNGLHWSLVIRLTKAMPRSSCFIVIMGQLVLVIGLA